MTKLIRRRDFLKDSAVIVAGAAIGASPGQPEKSRVVLVRHQDSVQAGSRFNAEVIQQMLDEEVTALLNKESAIEAFQSLIRPGETVGTKSSVWSYLPTPAALEAAIKRRVMNAGVKEEDIAIDDHFAKENPLFQKSTSLTTMCSVPYHPRWLVVFTNVTPLEELRARRRCWVLWQT